MQCGLLLSLTLLLSIFQTCTMQRTIWIWPDEYLMPLSEEQSKRNAAILDSLENADTAQFTDLVPTKEAADTSLIQGRLIKMFPLSAYETLYECEENEVKFMGIKELENTEGVPLIEESKFLTSKRTQKIKKAREQKPLMTIIINHFFTPLHAVCHELGARLYDSRRSFLLSSLQHLLTLEPDLSQTDWQGHTPLRLLLKNYGHENINYALENFKSGNADLLATLTRFKELNAPFEPTIISDFLVRHTNIEPQSAPEKLLVYLTDAVKPAQISTLECQQLMEQYLTERRTIYKKQFDELFCHCLLYNRSFASRPFNSVKCLRNKNGWLVPPEEKVKMLKRIRTQIKKWYKKGPTLLQLLYDDNQSRLHQIPSDLRPDLLKFLYHSFTPEEQAA